MRAVEFYYRAKGASIIARSVQSNVADNEQYIIFVSHQTAVADLSNASRNFQTHNGRLRKAISRVIAAKRHQQPLQPRLDESMSSWDPLIFPLNGLDLCNGKVSFILSRIK